MSNRRKQQHRKQRDTNTREKRELEQENRKLKREVSRLRKVVTVTPPEFDGEVDEESPKTPQQKCPNCKGSNLFSITTPSGKIRYTCRACSWRGAI